MDALRREAQGAYPNECCGLLVGRKDGEDWLVEEVVPSANLSDTPAKSFEVDPALRLALHKSLRGQENRVIGHYHSHPESRAEPSARDIASAWEADMVWLIVAVKAAVAGDVRAYWFEDEEAGFSPLAIETAS